MRSIASIILAVALSAAAARDAAAQFNPARFGEHRDHVYTVAGLDPAIVTGAGYGRVVSMVGRDVQFSGELVLGATRLDVADFRARLGLTTTLLQWRSLRLNGSIVGIARGTENQIYRGYNFGSDATGAAGVYRRRWFAAGEFGFDKNIITHISHSSWYRTNVYADARNGWYKTAGGTFHYGVTGGFAVGPTEVALRLGARRTERWNDVTPPIYATVGIGYGF